ncbi:hypothetical protein F4818DRAFT_404150 [Hypoxylon cercidicola]|nr:hypothetical protein F4818DRAFT_404150 [Hypoxylon cercidicola]
MKSILVLVTTTALAVSQIGYVAASLNALLVSSTSEDMPSMSTTIQDSSLTGTDSATSISTSTSTSTGSDSFTSANVTSTPTVSSGPFMNITSTGTGTGIGTLTETLGGITPSVTISGSLTESPTTTSPNAGATPAKIGAGVLVGVFGIVAAVL